MTRSIRQPGIPNPSRIIGEPCAASPVEITLPAGPRLLDALAALLDSAESACLNLEGGAFGPFAYVIPALSPDGSQAAFYSETFRPAGASRLDTAALTLGWRDGQPFFHCHALWTEQDGRPGCGHVLPEDTVIAAPIRVRGAAITGARFETQLDPETGFRLFSPRPTTTKHPEGAAPAIALRLAPNQDLAGALEDTGWLAGFGRARLHGGVGSIIEARFTDAPPMVTFATEMLVRQGSIRCDADAGPPTSLQVAIVDCHGAIAQGHLVPGDNPVLMTFEGLLLAEEPDHA